MAINEAGVKLIKKFEGCYLYGYKDCVGVWTIGYGHTGKVRGEPISKKTTITQKEAEDLLKKDLSVFYEKTFLKSYVPVTAELNENQRAALTSLAFNCGANALKTLCANRTIDEIADAFLLYNKAGGKAIAGLTERRKAERELFLTGRSVSEMPMLKEGCLGAPVYILQYHLNRILLDSVGQDECITIDGDFGTATKKAVEKVQSLFELTADGIIGKKTWDAIIETIA